jgi:hypothetical protein
MPLLISIVPISLFVFAVWRCHVRGRVIFRLRRQIQQDLERAEFERDLPKMYEITLAKSEEVEKWDPTLTVSPSRSGAFMSLSLTVGTLQPIAAYASERRSAPVTPANVRPPPLSMIRDSFATFNFGSPGVVRQEGVKTTVPPNYDTITASTIVAMPTSEKAERTGLEDLPDLAIGTFDAKLKGHVAR